MVLNERNKTGLATIDQPWMQQYPNYNASIQGVYINDKTVWDVTESLLEKYSHIPHLEYFGRKISREDFAEYVVTWARAFRALGVEKGDYIPLYVPATPESFAMFFAANAIGAVPYYQKIAITKEALERETKEARIAVVFDGLWNNVKDVFSNDRFKNVIITSAADSMMFPLKQVMKMKSYFETKKTKTGVPNGFKYVWTDDAIKIAKYYTGGYKVPFEPERIAAITTSSGTTSNNVKGIMDTNEGILASLACTINAETGYTEGKRTFTNFPPTASTSLNCLQLLPTFTGGTIIFDPRVDITKIYDQLMKYKPDISILTGPVLEQFVMDLLKKENGKRHNLTWVDYFIMGGAGTNPEILNYMNAVLRERGAQRDISVGYGLSEIFGVLSVAKYNGNYKESENKKDVIGVGIPLPGYVVGIFDETGKELPYGQGFRGELRVKAPSNMEGYYEKPSATAETLVDGWIHTGDLCEIDDLGNIYVYGRLKDTINIDDKPVYLFDIANDLRKTFKLHDVIVENRKLENDETSLVVYFAQNENMGIDSKELVCEIDEYLATKNISINGYKEFDNSLPIDPTTLKPRRRDNDGFVKYINGEKYDVSYEIVDGDVYSETKTKQQQKKLKK